MTNKLVVSLFCIISFSLYSNNRYFNQGTDFFKSRDYSHAIEYLQKALAEEPEKISIYYYLGISFYHQKIFKEAAFNLNHYLLNVEIKEIQPFREAFNTLVSIYNTKKEWDNIIQIGKTLLGRIAADKTFAKLEPMINNAMASAYLQKGNQFFQIKNYAEAKRLFQESFTINPKNLAILEKLGMSNYFLGFYEEAEKNFISFLQSNTTRWQNISSADYYLSRITTDLATVVEAIREKNTLSADILNVYGLFKNANYDAGFQALQEIEKTQTTNGAITLDIIKKIEKETSYPEELYIRFIRDYPDSNQVNWVYRRALTLAKNSDRYAEMKKELEHIIEKIIEQLPEHKKPEYEKMLLDIRFDNPTEETDDFLRVKIEKYLAVAMKYPESETAKNVLFEVAMMYANNLGEYSKAVEILEDLEKKGNYRNCAVELARIYNRQKNYEKAILLLKKVLAEQPENENVKMMLGETLLNSGSYDEGIKTLREVESVTKNLNLKKNLTNILKDYSEVYPEQEGEIKNFVYLHITESEISFSTSTNIDRDSPVLKQYVLNVSIYPFSLQKALFPFVLEIESQDKPSLTEPYTVYTKTEEARYIVQWQSETTAIPDRWRNKSPFKVIYPWKEIVLENIIVTRTNKVEGNDLVVEIEFFLPSEDWTIEIRNPSYPMKKDGIFPAPDVSGSSFVSYSNRGNHMKISMLYPKHTDITGYYPEVVMSRKVTDFTKTLTTSGIVQTDGIVLKTPNAIDKIILMRASEQNISLSEKIEK